MKKIGCFTAIMLIAVILLPLLIVKSCSTAGTKITDKQNKSYLKVYLADSKKTVNMQVEDYVKCVVAAEMPAEFGQEALKAQAVAARTYALARANGLYRSSKDTTHKDADVCTDPGHCQAFVSKEAAYKRWGIFSAFRYWSKISKAVDATSGLVITYKGQMINPLFHSNSGGHTENIEDVWGGDPEPYLKGVVREGEENSSEYKRTTVIDKDTFLSKLKGFNNKIDLKDRDIASEIKIGKLSSGGSVMSLTIGAVQMKGNEFRKLFDLRSAKFKLDQQPDGSITITTLGWGHGVGMSQCGANYLASKNKSYIDILKYYYQGVEIENIKK